MKIVKFVYYDVKALSYLVSAKRNHNVGFTYLQVAKFITLCLVWYDKIIQMYFGGSKQGFAILDQTSGSRSVFVEQELYAFVMTDFNIVIKTFNVNAFCTYKDARKIR